MKMITFEIPEIKPSDAEVIAGPVGPPVIYLPANKEIIEALEVDMNVDVVLKGRVKSVESRETASDSDRYEFTLEVKQVKIDEENEYTQLAEDD